ncbi:hypothetical protein BGM26_09590 [Bacillus sp. FJAT-29790]|uniref:hypothetical protein n=1 Tax=Bacillus sp. FJAT-29790 TaxID=1895002 RepID=UPI001C24B59B|nr:hypothetical protein [Bacillus sp. FJAT-29790]MBU8879234.1 hypothetical protein [Bacillus sp. FJAT-29790]
MIIDFIDFSNAQHISLVTTSITAVITLTTLFFTIRNNKSNNFVNSVNKERIDSLKNLKVNVAEFNSLLFSIIYENGSKETSYIIKLKCLIEFQLNSKKSFELEIISHLNNIVKLHTVLRNPKDHSKEELLSIFSDLKINIPANLIYLNNKQFITSLLKIEQNLFEDLINKHIKNEWERIKKDSRA